MNKNTVLKFLGGFLIVCALQATCGNLLAQNNILINENGGADTSFNDGLKIVITPNGRIHVYRGNQAQYCCETQYPTTSGQGVNLQFRFYRKTGLNTTDAVTLTNCSTTPAVLNGNVYTASVSGYAISPLSKKKFYVTINFSYTVGEYYFYADYYVRAPSDLVTPETVHIYLDHDSHILGCDASQAYRSTTNGEFIGNYRGGQSCYICSANNKYPSHHGFKVNGSFESYYSAGYSDRNTLSSGTYKLTNTLNTGSCIDDGVAVHFLLKNSSGTNMLSAGQTGTRRVAHCYGNKQGDFDSLVITDPTPGEASGQVTVNFTSPAFTEVEGSSTHTASNIKITVQGGTLTQQQICNFTITSGTAIQNTDYTFQAGFIIPAGNYAAEQTFTLNNVAIIGNSNCQLANRSFTMAMNDEACNDLVVRGTNYTTTVTIEDDDVPPMNQPSNPGPYCRGATVPAITFSGNTFPGGSYRWTNNNTAIGLAASGTGDIASFTATNTGTTPLTATISVYPVQGSCEGVAKTFTITVYANLTAGSIGSAQTICHNTAPVFLPTAPTGGTGSYSYQWQSSTDGSNWSDDVTTAAFSPGNLTASTYFRRNVSSGSCGTVEGTAILVTVNPPVTVEAIADKEGCINTSIPATTFASSSGGVTFTWANDNPSIGLASGGTGSQPQFTAAQTGTATITVTPHYNNCPGTPTTYTISVYACAVPVNPHLRSR